MYITVYATPDNIVDREIKEQRAVVIDALRATSTIVTALYQGCREVIPVIEIEEAMNISRIYEKDSYLLCGERNIQGIEGFHLSNSPGAYRREIVEGKTLLLTTTNGTRAIHHAASAGEVLIAAFNNAGATAEYLRSGDANVCFVCAGTDKRFSLDDIAAAGAIIHRMIQQAPSLELSDLALVCLRIYESAQGDLDALLKDSSHYRRLLNAGLEADLEHCLALDTAPVVARFKDGVVRSVKAHLAEAAV